MDSILDDELLDFELENLLALPKPAAKKRKSIDLDALLDDCEETVLKRSKSKGAKARRRSTEDDEERAESKLLKAVDDVHKLIKEIDGQDNASNELDVKDDVPGWGIQVFGNPKPTSPVACPALESSGLLLQFISNGLSPLVELNMAEGEDFLKGFMLNGWLTKFLLKLGHVEEFIAKWCFNLMLFSPEESLRTAACDCWCSILLHDEVRTSVNIDWLPSYSELKAALQSFGFLLYTPASRPSNLESSNNDSDGKMLPNVLTWTKFVAVCCQARRRHRMFSTREAEELVGVVICFFLDRRFLGLSVSLQECVLTSIGSFEEEEWNTSCGAIAKFLACRVPRDMNCLRIVECMSGINERSKMLRSRIAFEILKMGLEKASSVEDILRTMASYNLKNKSCDLVDIFIYLVLTHNLLISDDVRDKEVDEKWGLFLQKSSTQITQTDFRRYAQEVRNRAAYLLQGVNIC